MASVAIVAAKKSGVYANISVALVRGGVIVSDRAIEYIGDDLAQYILTVDAIDDKLLSTVKRIEAFDDVVAIDVVGRRLPSLTLDQNQGVLQNLILANPSIVGIVRDFTASLGKDEAAASTLFSLGYEFSTSTVKLNFTYPVSSIAFACDEFVLPAIAPYSVAERRSNQLVVRLCPFCRESPEHIQQCSFLNGVVAGIIRSFPNWSEAEVRERSSRAAGDAECVFHISL